MMLTKVQRITDKSLMCVGERINEILYTNIDLRNILERTVVEGAFNIICTKLRKNNLFTKSFIRTNSRSKYFL